MKCRKWQPTPVFLPGKHHGLRILVGYSPWGHKKLDTTERLQFTSFHFHLQCRRLQVGSWAWKILWRRDRLGYLLQDSWASLVAQLLKNPPASAGDLGSIPGLGRSPGEGNHNNNQFNLFGHTLHCRYC